VTQGFFIECKLSEKEYAKELKGNELLEELRALEKKHKIITFVYGAKDEEHNNAVALKEFLEK